jgi:hypothetical protein
MTDAMRTARDRWLANPDSAGTGKAFEAGWRAHNDWLRRGPMNYLDQIANEIHRAAYGDTECDPDDLPLYRIYAVLTLAKGTKVTAEDAHDGWSAWCAGTQPDHPCLIPFEELNSVVQSVDEPYVAAIRRVASLREGEDT